MDDLIYILLGLVWVALALYRNNQKKKQREAARTQTTHNEQEEVYEERDAGSLLEEILLGRKNPEPVPDTETMMTDYDISESKQVKGTSFTPSKATFEFEEEYNLLGITSLEELDIKSDSDRLRDKDTGTLEVEIIQLEEEAAQGSGFDLKKAVIYSEILNRKHF